MLKNIKKNSVSAHDRKEPNRSRAFPSGNEAFRTELALLITCKQTGKQKEFSSPEAPLRRDFPILRKGQREHAAVRTHSQEGADGFTACCGRIHRKVRTDSHRTDKG